MRFEQRSLPKNVKVDLKKKKNRNSMQYSQLFTVNELSYINKVFCFVLHGFIS